MPVFNVVSQLQITGDHLEHWLPRVMCLSERKFDKSLKNGFAVVSVHVTWKTFHGLFSGSRGKEGP